MTYDEEEDEYYFKKLDGKDLSIHMSRKKIG